MGMSKCWLAPLDRTYNWLPSMEEYSGVENLEAMEEAINYQRYLSGLIIELASAVGSGGSLLDFGAGVGTYARQARVVGYSVLCVEIDVGLRLRLAKQGFDTVSELAEVPNESQRAVYSFYVLEHIEDDQAVLHHLFRVTAPGGRLLLYVPAFPVLFSSMDRRVGHKRRYHRRELLNRTETAGFAVDRCVYADSLGFFAALIYARLVWHSSGILSPLLCGGTTGLCFPSAGHLTHGCTRHSVRTLS